MPCTRELCAFMAHAGAEMARPRRVRSDRHGRVERIAANGRVTGESALSQRQPRCQLAATRNLRRRKMYPSENGRGVPSAHAYRGRRCGGSLWCNPRQSCISRSPLRRLPLVQSAPIMHIAVAAAAAPSGVLHSRALRISARRDSFAARPTKASEAVAANRRFAPPPVASAETT